MGKQHKSWNIEIKDFRRIFSYQNIVLFSANTTQQDCLIMLCYDSVNVLALTTSMSIQHNMIKQWIDH